MSGKPRRAQIGLEEQACIAKYAIHFSDMNRTKLAEKIQAEVKWPGKPPEIEVLERKISSYRKDSDLPQDKPWNLDALGDDILPAGVLKTLFSIWLAKQEDPSSPPLTIREAKWITQLSSMTEDTELLRIVAGMCAEWELIGELTKTPQLSSPVMVLHIYSLLTRMTEKELNEHYQEIQKEKHVSVSGTRRGTVIEGLGVIYGDEFLKTMKLKPRKKKGGTK